MLDILKDRILKYNIETADTFFNSFPHVFSKDFDPVHPLSVYNFPNSYLGYNLWAIMTHNRQRPYMIWEKYQDGYICYSKTSAVFFDINGFIYKLSCTQLPLDWKFHNALFNLNEKEDLIRLEIPITIKKIKLLDKTYFYSKVYRDNYQNAINIHHLHFLKKLDRSTLIKLIDECTKKIYLIKKVSKKTIYCPSIGTVLPKLSIDSDTLISGCWTDIKHCNVTFDEYLHTSYVSIKDYLIKYRNNDVLNNQQANEVLAYTNNEWKKFGLKHDV